MKSRNWFRRFGREASFDDLVDAARQKEGRHAARWIADKLGVSHRTAQRYLARTQRPSKRTAARSSNLTRMLGRQISADRIRQIRTVRPVGRVAVYSKSDGGDEGTRRIGTVNVGPMMDRVADLYEQGRDQEAADLFDDAVIAGYGGEPVDDHSGLASVLGIKNYRGGLRYTTDD